MPPDDYAMEIIPPPDAEEPENEARRIHGAARPSYDPYYTGSYGTFSPQQVEHPILYYQLARAGPGYRQAASDLLHEIVEKDANVSGLLHARRCGLLQRDLAILEYDSSPEALQAAAFIETVFERVCGGLHQVIYSALDAIPYGDCAFERRFKTVSFPLPREIDPLKGERLRPSAWTVWDYSHFHPRRVGSNDEGEPLIYALFKTEEEANAAGYDKTDWNNWWKPRPYTCSFFKPYTYYEQHHGYPLMATIFGTWWYKRQMQQLWALYADKWTTPVVSVEGQPAAPGLSTEDKTELDLFIAGFTRDMGARLPAGWTVRLLELNNMGALNIYESFIRYCDEMEAIAIIGQTATAQSSGAGGTKAFGEVQERRFLDILALDARLVEQWVNDEIRLLMEYNMPDQVHRSPRLAINTRSAQEVKVWADVTESMLKQGLKIPVRFARRFTGIDQPRKDEEVLEMQPANYSNSFGGKPQSQQPAAKARQKQTERSRARAPQGTSPARP